MQGFGFLSGRVGDLRAGGEPPAQHDETEGRAGLGKREQGPEESFRALVVFPAVVPGQPPARPVCAAVSAASKTPEIDVRVEHARPGGHNRGRWAKSVSAALPLLTAMLRWEVFYEYGQIAAIHITVPGTIHSEVAIAAMAADTVVYPEISGKNE